MNTDNIIKFALVGIGGYIIYRMLTGASAALSTVGNAIGSGLYEAFNPNVLGQTQFLTVNFPDGTSHTVAAGLINSSSGTFTVPANDSSGTYVTPQVSQQYGGNTYSLVDDANGNHFAILQGTAAGGSSVSFTPGASIATDVYSNLLAAGV